MTQAQPQRAQPQLYSQAQPQMPQAQPRVTQAQLAAPRQPPLSPCRQPQAQTAPPPVRRLVQDPLVGEDKQSSVDFVDEAALHERQVRSELPDRVAKFCGLKRTLVADTTKVTGIMNPPYHA